MFHFMFPANPIDPKVIDAHFKPEAEVLSPEGYSLFSFEEGRLRGIVPEGACVIYRGWMLTPEQYAVLHSLVQRRGGTMLVSPREYANAHHLPEWYPVLAEATAETYVVPNTTLAEPGFDLTEVLRELQGRGWAAFFFKDYVKSLKTGMGSVVVKPEDADKVVEMMKHFRDGLEGGLCIRRYEHLRDEQRYFVIRGKIYWSDYRDADLDVADVAAKRIDSPFFSVDVAYNNEHQPRIVEIGDGQVSGLVGWTPQEFALAFKRSGLQSSGVTYSSL